MGRAKVMPGIKPIALLLLLTGCGYMGCISQSNVFNDVVTVVAPTNPGAGQPEGSTNVQYWRRVDFPFAGKELTLRVEEKEPRFCEESELDNVRIDVPYNKAIDKCKTQDFNIKLSYPLLKGEGVIFSLNPVREFTVTQEICRNQDEYIYVYDTDKCIKDYIGTIHLVNSSSKLARKNGFSNEWHLIDDEQDTPVIEDFVPSIILYSGIQEGEKNTIDVKSSVNDDLCKTSRTVIEEAKKKADEEGKNNNNNNNGSTGVERLEKALHDANKKVREEREKYRSFLDETAINTICNKLCGFGEEQQQSGQQTSNGNGKCVAYRPVSRSDRVGKGAVSSTVIPFLKLKQGDFKHDTEKSDKLDFGAGTGKVTDFSVVEKLIDKDKIGSVDLSKLKDSTNGANNAQNVLKALPKVGEYLALDTFYKVEKNKIEQLVIEVSNEADEQCNGGSSSSSSGSSGGKKLAGSYSISMYKDCSGHVKDSLYYVFSEGYPQQVPQVGQGNNAAGNAKKLDFSSGNEITINAKNEKGDLYFCVLDNGDGYANNSGHFEIRISAPRTPPKVFSHIVTWTEDKVKAALYGRNNNDSVVKKMYMNISQHGSFTNMVNAMLILYVMVSTLYFFLGFSKASIFQLGIMISKIIVVMYVLRPDSWTFFNNHLFNLFIEGPKNLIDIMTGGKGGNFEFMDMVLFRFSITETWIQILALMFSGPIGLLSVILILWSLVVLVQCLFEAVVIYLISILSIALLLCIAPYFVICVLFRRTKNIFDMWIKTLLQTGMQPVIIFSCIALLTSAINNVIYAVLNFEVCDTCVLDLNLVLFTLCLLKFPMPVGVIAATPINDTIREVYNTGNMVLLGLPGPIFNVILLIVLVRAARDFVVSSGELCSVMFGSFTNLSDVGGKAVQSLLSVVGMDQNTSHIVESHRRQSELFDKGPGGGRSTRPMPGMGGGAYPTRGDSGAGNVRRRQIIAHQDPPSSF